MVVEHGACVAVEREECVAGTHGVAMGGMVAQASGVAMKEGQRSLTCVHT